MSSPKKSITTDPPIHNRKLDTPDVQGKLYVILQTNNGSSPSESSFTRLMMRLLDALKVRILVALMVGMYRTPDVETTRYLIPNGLFQLEVMTVSVTSVRCTRAFDTIPSFIWEVLLEGLLCYYWVHHLLFFLPYITHIQKIQEYCTFYNGRLYIFRMITSERDQKQFDEITSDLEELTQDATLSLSLGEMLTPLTSILLSLGAIGHVWRYSFSSIPAVPDFPTFPPPRNQCHSVWDKGHSGGPEADTRWDQVENSVQGNGDG